jgi:PAS domain S-box-containing protein
MKMVNQNENTAIEKWSAHDLRRRAEAIRAERLRNTRVGNYARGAMTHELEVNSIELEMQHDELSRLHSELQVSRNKYVDLFESSPTGYVTLNTKGLIETTNVTFAEQVGMFRGTLVSMPFFRLVCHPDRNILHQHIKNALGSPERQGCQVRLCNPYKRGYEAYATLTSQAVHPDNGSGITIRMAVTDITPQMLAEFRQHKTEESYRTLLQSIEGYIYDIEYDEGRRPRTYHSTGCHDLTGYTPEEFHNDPNLWLQITHPEDRSQLKAKIENFHVTHAPSRSEHRIVRKNGQVRWVLNSISAVVDDRGRLKREMGFIVDVTARHEIEAQLKQYQNHLEELVEERTRALTEAQAELIQARDEAIKASAAKTRFLAAAGHDLRQPVQAAAMLTSLLADENKPEKRRELVKHLKISLRSLSELLDSLLDLSRLDAGIIVPEVSDFPVARVFDRLQNDIALLAGAKGLKFRIRNSGEFIRSDPRLLEQILRNLLQNALKFTKQGGILVACRRTAKGARIQVFDTGCGIPADQLGIVFEEYARLKKTACENADGLGLGLTLVERLTGLLKHGLHVKSRPGRGSCFELLIPFGASQNQTNATRLREQAERAQNV